MHGLPCSGKTFIAGRLCTPEMAFFSTDALRMELRKPELFDNQVRESVYKEMFSAAEHSLNLGKDVMLDATFSKRVRREAIYRICNLKSASVVVVSCTAPEPVLRERMQVRLSLAVIAPELRIDTLDSVQHEYEPIEFSELEGLKDAAIIQVATDVNSSQAVFAKGKAKFTEHIKKVLNY